MSDYGSPVLRFWRIRPSLCEERLLGWPEHVQRGRPSHTRQADDTPAAYGARSRRWSAVAAVDLAHPLVRHRLDAVLAAWTREPRLAVDSALYPFRDRGRCVVALLSGPCRGDARLQSVHSSGRTTRPGDAPGVLRCQQVELLCPASGQG